MDRYTDHTTKLKNWIVLVSFAAGSFRMVETIFPRFSWLGISKYRWPLVLDWIHYCFLGIIRKELNSVKEDWNSYIISRSHKSGPTERPSSMYHLPHLYDKQDCVQRINKEETEEFDSVVGELPSDFTPKFSDFERTVMHNNGIKTLKKPSEALNL